MVWRFWFWSLVLVSVIGLGFGFGLVVGTLAQECSNCTLTVSDERIGSAFLERTNVERTFLR